MQFTKAGKSSSVTGVLLHLDGDFRGICVALANAVERLTCVISKAESFRYSLS